MNVLALCVTIFDIFKLCFYLDFSDERFLLNLYYVNLGEWKDWRDIEVYVRKPKNSKEKQIQILVN